MGQGMACATCHHPDHSRCWLLVLQNPVIVSCISPLPNARQALFNATDKICPAGLTGTISLCLQEILTFQRFQVLHTPSECPKRVVCFRAHSVEEGWVGDDGTGAGVEGGQRLVGAQQRGVLPRSLINGDHVPGQRSQRRRIADQCLVARHHHVWLGHLRLTPLISTCMACQNDLNETNIM